MRQSFTIIIAALLAPLAALRAETTPPATAPEPMVAPADTTDTYDEGEQLSDTTGKTRLNTARGFNALQYVMERRNRRFGDGIGTKWNDNLFLYGGLGGERMIKPHESYSFKGMTSMHFGIGKQFDQYHTARIALRGTFGYRNGNGLMLSTGGLQADYLFNFSSLFDGYNPTRRLEVQSIIGVGAGLSRVQRLLTKQFSMEGHVGLQLKFYTGPGAYFNIEPYFGVSTDKRDIGNENWRRFDTFYGVNLSYVYYLKNNLSSSRKQKMIAKRNETDEVLADTMLASWHRPWFIQVSAGLNFMNSPMTESGINSTLGTLGHETSVALGKWFSPVIGARLTANLSTGRWYHNDMRVGDETVRMKLHKGFSGFRLEALINPLGFSKKFRWDSRFGLFFFGGGAMGRILAYDPDQVLSSDGLAYTFGLNGWVNVGNGLRFFIEPRLTRYIYDIPYANVEESYEMKNWGRTLNFGFIISTIDKHKRRQNIHLAPADKRFTVGGGLGTNLRQTTWSIERGFGYNAQIWGEYKLDRVSSVRASFDYASIAETAHAAYNLDRPGAQTFVGWDLMKFRYHTGLLSVAYAMNLSNFFRGYSDTRQFEVSAFLGPSLFLMLGESATLHPAVKVPEGSTATLADPMGMGVAIGANVGFRVNYNINDNWGVYLSPSVLLWYRQDPKISHMLGVNHIQALNIGAMYNF